MPLNPSVRFDGSPHLSFVKTGQANMKEGSTKGKGGLYKKTTNSFSPSKVANIPFSFPARQTSFSFKFG